MWIFFNLKLSTFYKHPLRPFSTDLLNHFLLEFIKSPAVIHIFTPMKTTTTDLLFFYLFKARVPRKELYTMKLVFSKSNLLKSVSIVMKAVPSRTTMPILECIPVSYTHLDVYKRQS